MGSNVDDEFTRRRRRLRESRRTRLFILFVLIIVIASLSLIYYGQSRDLIPVVLIILVALIITAVVLAAIHYALYMQERLLDDVADILYDKAVALENAKKARVGRVARRIL